MDLPTQGQVQVTRSVAIVEGQPIVVEIFKDATGKIVRQQSFTKDQLTATKTQTDAQYTSTIARLNELIALLA